MKHLYFCRHGLSVLNQAGLLAGSTNTPLVEEGREQARAAGVAVKDLEIDFIICSPLSRALETAEIIADAIGYDRSRLESNNLFKERHFGSLEGQPYKRDYSAEDLSDSETLESISDRARQAYAYLQTLEAENILVVSHSSFGRALRHVISPDVPHHGSPHFENATIVQLV